MAPNAESRVQPGPAIGSVDDLAEISSWLGTYKERLRKARADEREGLAGDVHRWDSRLKERRAELA
jgi:hypothetical protein